MMSDLRHNHLSHFHNKMSRAETAEIKLNYVYVCRVVVSCDESRRRLVVTCAFKKKCSRVKKPVVDLCNTPGFMYQGQPYMGWACRVLKSKYASFALPCLRQRNGNV